MSYTAAMGRKPAHRERINITLPIGLPDVLSDVAGRQGRDRSALLEEAAKTYLTSIGVSLPKLKLPARKPKKG